MKNLLEFTQRIENLLAVEEKRNQSLQQELNLQHRRRTERLTFYEEKAGLILGTIIRPRMEKLIGYFENASLSSPNFASGYCRARFQIRPRFPASTTLGFSVSHDVDMRNLYIKYTLQILPIFVKFDKQDIIEFSIDAVDESKCEKWVEQKLVSFLEVYLQLGHLEQYQKQNLVIDPFCGVQVNKAYAISEGALPSQIHFFCSEDCRVEFISKLEESEK